MECNADGYNFHVNSYLSEVEILQGDLFSFPSLATHNSLYLGLLNGFITFSPDNMGDSHSLSRPLFTSFRLFNVPILSGEKYNGRVLFDKALSYSKKVSLEYNENYVTLEFSGLNYLNPSQTSFRYQLDGFERNGRKHCLKMGRGVLHTIIFLQENMYSVFR